MEAVYLDTTGSMGVGALWLLSVAAALSLRGQREVGARVNVTLASESELNATVTALTATIHSKDEAVGLVKNKWPWTKYSHIYIASMGKDLYRMKWMRSVMLDLGVYNYQVFPASDGLDPTQVPLNLLPSMRRANLGCGPMRTVMPDFSAYMNRPWDYGEQEGTLGCYMTHLRMLQDAIAKGYETVLLFEDDIEPLGYGSTSVDRAKMVRSLPASWDMMYLGWYQHNAGAAGGNGVNDMHDQTLSVHDCTPWGDGLCKLNAPVLQQTHAIAVNKKALQPLVNFLERGLEGRTACAVDQMYRAFKLTHPEFEVFAAQSPIFGQKSASGFWGSQITPAALAGESTDKWPGQSGEERMKKMLFR